MRGGYTLIELLIVLGIGVILGTVGFINYTGYGSERRLEGVVDGIAATLRHTQSRSVAQEDGKQWGVHFENPSSGADFYQIFSGDTWAAGTREVRRPLGRPVVFVAPTTGNSIDVIFTKRTGTTTAATITLALSSATTTTQKSITVNAQGNIEQ